MYPNCPLNNMSSHSAPWIYAKTNLAEIELITCVTLTNVVHMEKAPCQTKNNVFFKLISENCGMWHKTERTTANHKVSVMSQILSHESNAQSWVKFSSPCIKAFCYHVPFSISWLQFENIVNENLPWDLFIEKYHISFPLSLLKLPKYGSGALMSNLGKRNWVKGTRCYHQE